MSNNWIEVTKKNCDANFTIELKLWLALYKCNDIGVLVIIGADFLQLKKIFLSAKFRANFSFPFNPTSPDE